MDPRAEAEWVRESFPGRFSGTKLNGLGTLVPSRNPMVKTKRELGCLVEGHFVLVFASKLGESTDSLMDPLIAIDLLATRSFWRNRRYGIVGSGFRNDSNRFSAKRMSVAGWTDEYHWSISGPEVPGIQHCTLRIRMKLTCKLSTCSIAAPGAAPGCASCTGAFRSIGRFGGKLAYETVEVSVDFSVRSKQPPSTYVLGAKLRVVVIR